MRLFLCMPLLAAIPGIAFAEPLTFDAALQRARQEAPSIKAKTLGVDAARSARGAAGALPDPTLAVGVDSFPIWRHLKVCAPDNDLADIMRTLAMPRV